MSNELFFNVFDKSSSVPASVVKANKLTVANFEKLVAFQMSSFQYYVDLGLTRVKDAAGVSNLQEWQDFVSGQMEFAHVLNQKVFDDAKTLREFGADFQADFDHLVKQVLESAPEAIKETTDKVVKETEKATGEKVA